MEKSEPTLVQALIRAFAVAVLLYVGFYACDHHLRTRKGPWEATFAGTAGAPPAIELRQPGLGIEGTRIEFPGGEASIPTPITVRFDSPRVEVPFGEVIFDDLMYWPGTVTLSVFGHQIELLPRTLIIDGTEFPWSDAKIHRLGPPPAPPTASGNDTAAVP